MDLFQTFEDLENVEGRISDIEEIRQLLIETVT